MTAAQDAAAAALLFAIDPHALGLVLHGPPCPARDTLLDAVAAAGLPLHRLPCHIAIDRLTGGLDLAATLAVGRPVQRAGVLADSSGACLVLAMAERWDAHRIGLIAAALDGPEPPCLIALDEGQTPDEALHPALRDRCAFVVPLAALPGNFAITLAPAIIADAAARLPQVEADEAITTAICAAAAALGIHSLRACLLATRVARTAAAHAGRLQVNADDAALAVRLVLSPRATHLPEQPEEPHAETAPDASPDPPSASDQEPDQPQDGAEGDELAANLDDIVLAAARAAIPAHLLSQMAANAADPTRPAPGKSGLARGTARHGRPIGARPGLPRDGSRLDLIATLRTAAPWQALRGRTGADQRLRLVPDDLRIRRCRPRTETTTIFAVDASGSQALARLAEAKGAIELLLADCYVRRDRVAVVAFRGAGATLLLPPTRAPARARRSLGALPGGGGTPLAAGIDAAAALAEAAARAGQYPTIVLLTDGQANISRAGHAGRAAAQQDAMDAARALRARRHRCLLIDTAARRQPLAQSLAEAMGARYLALPRADAAAVSQAVRLA